MTERVAPPFEVREIHGPSERGSQFESALLRHRVFVRPDKITTDHSSRTDDPRRRRGHGRADPGAIVPARFLEHGAAPCHQRGVGAGSSRPSGQNRRCRSYRSHGPGVRARRLAVDLRCLGPTQRMRAIGAGVHSGTFDPTVYDARPHPRRRHPRPRHSQRLSHRSRRRELAQATLLVLKRTCARGPARPTLGATRPWITAGSATAQ